MQITQLFDDDRAVSPVIGVILMVAITVILAAVIGTFVLGLGDQVQNTTPQAQFGFSTGTDLDSNDDIDYVNVTHESGDSIDSADLKLNINGTNNAWPTSGTVSAGSAVSVVSSDGSGISTAASSGTSSLNGGTVRVVYDNPDNDKSSTLAKFDIPE